MKTRITSFFAAAMFAVLFVPGVAHAEEPAWTSYRKVLKRYVRYGTVKGVKTAYVKYRSLRNSSDWKKTVNNLANYDVRKLKTRREKLAFYINAYNILAIKAIADRYPVRSIQDLKIWDRKVGKIGGKSYSLNHVEKRIVARLADGRFHFALVCAAVSCPDLRRTPYVAKYVYGQMNINARSFLRNKTKGVQIAADGTAKGSELFYWYKNDFGRWGGPEGFIKKYGKNVPANLKLSGKIRYNWALNGR